MGDSESPGGTACGMNAYAEKTGENTLPSLDEVMMNVGAWVEKGCGTFLGHVKMAVTTDKDTMTLNLTDLDQGVEHHGIINTGVRADIKFMAAVLDADHNELEKKMKAELTSKGFKIKGKGLIELK